ncbi:LPS assembly lipoprotein LptE [Ottowia thiooxydans]|uniref:LPS-assembly lipoprotein LptE n=1 Tax=Ottowia thiooxydans TaxID=219182 RepID=UPI00055F32C9|nr:LPS assembly lipoprotein LptE [Ottowia thiooxydans]
MSHSVNTRRRFLLALPVPMVLAGCGFALRKPPDFSFRSIYVAMSPGSSLGNELRRQLTGTGRVQVITDVAKRNEADVVLEGLQDLRERVVVGLNASGQVREFQLRVRFKFRVRTPAGKDVIPDTEILRQIDQSYSETAALSKEAEALMLYDNMQTDIVQQVLRRLATIKV